MKTKKWKGLGGRFISRPGALYTREKFRNPTGKTVDIAAAQRKLLFRWYFQIADYVKCMRIEIKLPPIRFHCSSFHSLKYDRCKERMDRTCNAHFNSGPLYSEVLSNSHGREYLMPWRISGRSSSRPPLPSEAHKKAVKDILLIFLLH